MKKTLTILTTLILFTSCRKEFEHIPQKFIHIEDMCFDGTNYQIKYNQIVADLRSPTFVILMRGRDTISKSQQITGQGEHDVTLNARESCDGVVKVYNGFFETEMTANCKACK